MVSGLEFEPRFFGESDSVFTGDGAAAPEGFVDDFVEGLVDASHLVVIFFVSEKSGVEVAVAHVSEGAHQQVVAFSGFRDKAHHRSEFRARDGDVFKDGGGTDPGKGGERVTARGC